jgi:hypothetical protein
MEMVCWSIMFPPTQNRDTKGCVTYITGASAQHSSKPNTRHLDRGHRFSTEFSWLSRLTPAISSCPMESAVSLAQRLMARVPDGPASCPDSLKRGRGGEARIVL